MVIYDSKGKIIKSALGPRNEKKAKELIDEYNSLSIGDSLYTSTNLGRYLDSYFREHGLSYGDDFMCPPYREGEIVKMSNKVVSSKQIKSTFELEGKDKRYNPFVPGGYKPDCFYWAGYWIDKSTPWIVFHTTDEAQIIIDDAFATEKEAKNLSEQLDHLYVEVENLDDVFPDEAERKYYENGKHALSYNIGSSRKPIKSSYEEAFTVYPWDPNQVTGTSDADLGLSYVVEAYGDEFVNVDEDTLNNIKDTLVQYFDDEAYVRDWNINYPNDQIEDAFDIVDPETMEVDDLAQYFDYEAYGRDIRLNKRMIWDSEEECWVSASDINDEDLDDSKYIWIGSSKQQIRSERASQTVDKHSAEDLELYAENTAEVYERFITPVVKNLRRKVKKGIYDEDKALIAWQNVIDEAAKMYDKEQGSGKGSLIMFNKATRNEAAKGLMERMSDDVFQEE